jgi:hypothetical protein
LYFVECVQTAGPRFLAFEQKYIRCLYSLPAFCLRVVRISIRPPQTAQRSRPLSRETLSSAPACPWQAIVTEARATLCDHALACLHGLPERIRDDPQLGQIDGEMLRRGTRHGSTVTSGASRR